MRVSQQRAAAVAFVEKWRDRGYEKGDTHSFWLELLRSVVGMEDVTTKCRFEQRTSHHGFIDVVIPESRTIVEQKSSTVNLDTPEIRQGVPVTPFEQAKRYADSLPNKERPDWIIVCNFTTFRIHSLNKANPAEDYLEFALTELPDQIHLLNFLVDENYSRLAKERKASIEAGELIGELYEGLRKCYLNSDTPEEQHALNVMCVRLVFCLFAEDAGLFPKDSFVNYLKGFPTPLLRRALLELFAALSTPVAERDPYAMPVLNTFPYVNGGLFRDPVAIPQFTDELRDLLVDRVAMDTDWSEISPTIFGGVFESTLNPDTRRSGGMHYTSPENIHRVIDPLFLDDLKAELAGYLEDQSLTERKRMNRLKAFQHKLGSLTFFEAFNPTWIQNGGTFTLAA